MKIGLVYHIKDIEQDYDSFFFFFLETLVLILFLTKLALLATDFV